MPSDPHFHRANRLASRAAGFVYAALLLAAVARLDGGPSPSRPGDARQMRPHAALPLSSHQAPPEGWPLWTGKADDRIPR